MQQQGGQVVGGPVACGQHKSILHAVKAGWHQAQHLLQQLPVAGPHGAHCRTPLAPLLPGHQAPSLQGRAARAWATSTGNDLCLASLELLEAARSAGQDVNAGLHPGDDPLLSNDHVIGRLSPEQGGAETRHCCWPPSPSWTPTCHVPESEPGL